MGTVQHSERAASCYNEAEAHDTATQVITSSGVAEEVTIPSGAKLMRIQPYADGWYSFEGSFSIPSVDDASGSPIMIVAGEKRYINLAGASSLHVNSVTPAAFFNIMFWS